MKTIARSSVPCSVLCLVASFAFSPALTAQENEIKVTICDSADIEGCEDKFRERPPFRMIFDPDVLEIDCDEEDGACTNESSRVVWNVVNKQDDHDADIKYAGRLSRHRRALTEQRITRGKRRSVSERPRNLNFDSNGRVSWRYMVTVFDADGRVYARRDPEIVIRRR